MKGGGNDHQDLNLPAGFRFHPTDEELVEHYLCRKCFGQLISLPKFIPEIDLYKFDPWQLPTLSPTHSAEKEWYFFSPRGRKYPNGSRPNRSAGTGYWKATGADKPVGKPKTLGIKKALVFYAGKSPTGVKTNWIMHEYRLAGVDRSSAAGKTSNMKLDEWVLCRIYNKKGMIEKYYNNMGRHDKAAAAAEGVFSDSHERKSNVNLLSDNCNTSVTTMPKLKTESISLKQQFFSLEFFDKEVEICSVDRQMNYVDGFHDAEPFGFGCNELIEYMQNPL